MKPDSASGDPQERKRLLELVAFARRTPDRPGFTWRHGFFIGLGVFSVLVAIRFWTTWRSFNRPIELSAEPGITAAEQRIMLASIRSRSRILDPVVMDAATFQTVFLGRGRIERSVEIFRDGGETQAIVCRSDGSSHHREWPDIRQFAFSPTGGLVELARPPERTIN